MNLKATELRKHLFTVLDSALHGEPVEINYKGAKLKLVPSEGGSKLAGAVRRHALLVDPQSIVESDTNLMADLEKQWIQNDKDL
jgi:antitoxin (DNA-binding transcriptional repressor) of toxin-antitoxin stability system